MVKRAITPDVTCCRLHSVAFGGIPENDISDISVCRTQGHELYVKMIIVDMSRWLPR